MNNQDQIANLAGSDVAGLCGVPVALPRVHVFPSRRFGQGHRPSGGTLESFAVEQASTQMGIRFRNRNLRRTVQNVSRHFGLDGDADWVDSTLREFTRRPDGYAVTWDVSRPHAQTYGPVFDLWLLEVEDTHPLSAAKLKALADLWLSIDASDHWELRLVVANRYGHGKEFDLRAAFYYFAGEPLGDRAGAP